MSLKIKNQLGIFDLQNDFSIEIEDTSPIYNERGSQSVPATLPASRNNLSLITHVHRPDSTYSPAPDTRVTVSDGVYNRIGKMNITQASKSGGIVSNIGFDESELYSEWNAVSLRSLSAPVIRPEGGTTGVISLLNSIMNETIVDDALSVFPICVSMPSHTTTVDDTETTTYYPEYINKIAKSENGSYFLQGAARQETFLINNEPVLTSVPEGYAISPFLKVSWILNLIFVRYGYTVLENPFSTHRQLSRLVVLNNMADSIVKGFIDYSDLLPDCTINEFLQALYCRFGMVYFVDGKNKTVNLKFIKDIISATPSLNWSLLKSACPVINYAAAQQLKLSASTNISGPYTNLVAAPTSDSLDKFLKPFGHVLSNNTAKGYLTYSLWDGFYYVRNNLTGIREARSSDFFPWDKGADISYMEISSIDECLPMKGSYPDDQPVCPAYLLGKVHKYTNISSASVELAEEQNTQTPLCFCFSMPRASTPYPYGSPRCYTPGGEAIVINGHTFDISMTFIGDNGLFSRFWKGFDAILRHSNHTVEVPVHLNPIQLLNIDFSQTINIDGQRLLLDTVRYTLPKLLSRPAIVRFRTLRLLIPVGKTDLDLDAEQGIQTIEQLYKWAFHNNRENIVELKIRAQVEEWKKAITPPAQWFGVLRKNEVSDQVSDIEIPFTVPTQEDYEAGKEFFIKEINYSFDLYYKVRVPNGQTSQGDIIWKDKEYGGVHYAITYGLSVKAELL